MSYVTLEQLRALPNLDDEVKFTDAELTSAISWFETTFEDYTGVAWETRTVTDERHDGRGKAFIQLNHLYPIAVTALELVGDSGGITAYGAGELADLRLSETGRLRRMALGVFVRGDGNLLVSYTHAKTASAPPDVVEAALVAIRDKLLTDNAGNRQFAVLTQEGIVRTSTPDPRAGRPFGIPFVDGVANSPTRFERVPAIA